MSKELKLALLSEYGSFADKRIKRMEKGDTFIVDDRDPHDQNSSGEFNMAFCFIWARVLQSGELRITLHRNVPFNDTVIALANAHGGKFEPGIQASLELTVKASEGKVVRELAAEIRAITAPGAPRYHTPSWKYAVPRVVKSLRRLADALDTFTASGGSVAPRATLL